jgi:hypothetical protein
MSSKPARSCLLAIKIGNLSVRSRAIYRAHRAYRAASSAINRAAAHKRDLRFKLLNHVGQFIHHVGNRCESSGFGAQDTRP